MAILGQITTEKDIFSGNNPATLMMGAGQIFSTISNLTAMDVDYEKLKLQANYQDMKAENIQLQTTQQANYLREQFTQNVGSYQYGTARRNVKIGEAGSNVEDSAKALGYDIQKMQGNADWQKNLLQMDADRLRMGAEDIKTINMWNKIGGAFGDLGKIANIAGQLDFSKETKDIIGPELPPPEKDKKVTQTHKNVPVPDMKMPDISTGPAITDLTAKTTGANPAQGKQVANQIAAVDSPEIYRIASVLNIEPTKVNGVIMAKSKGKTATQIAKEFGLTPTQVASIVNNQGG